MGWREGRQVWEGGSGWGLVVGREEGGGRGVRGSGQRCDCRVQSAGFGSGVGDMILWLKVGVIGKGVWGGTWGVVQ